MVSKDLELKCVCCGKSIKPVFEGDYSPETDMWDGSGVDTLLVGYGSRHDGFCFVVGICDDCIDKKLEEGGLIYRR